MKSNVFGRSMSLLFLLIEKLKGTKTVKEVVTPKNILGQLTGYSVDGWEITIHCQKKHFRRDYDRWFIPSEHLISYCVFGVVSNDAPADLKEACEFDLDLPAGIPKFMWDESQKEAAIEAYLDLLIGRLRTIKSKR